MTLSMDKLAEALERGDVDRYSITLTKLIDGKAEYTVIVNDNPPIVFPSHAEGSDYVDRFRRHAKARAVLSAIEAQGYAVVPREANDRCARAYLPCLLEATGDYSDVPVDEAMTRPRYEWLKMMAYRHWSAMLQSAPKIGDV